MYAVIQSGGKQYRVEPGEILDVELISSVGDGGAVEFDRVLMISGDGGVKVGSPTLDGAKVRAKVLSAVRGPKIRVFKTKTRLQYRRTKGHRQNLHRVQIQEIAG
jgi:large subunit ribosomal protein L21